MKFMFTLIGIFCAYKCGYYVNKMMNLYNSPDITKDYDLMSIKYFWTAVLFGVFWAICVEESFMLIVVGALLIFAKIKQAKQKKAYKQKEA